MTGIKQNQQDGGQTSEETLTRSQRNHKVVLYNDENHTYDYVVEMLTSTSKLSREQAFRCAVEVDISGRTIVHYGSHSDCALVKSKITHFGPDHRLPHSMGSMAAEVESV